MAAGILLVCDEYISISQDVQLVNIDNKWQLHNRGNLSKDVWNSATCICKGLGILVNAAYDKYCLVWEDGECEYINANLRQTKKLLREVNSFIVKRVGLKGLSERAFVLTDEEIKRKKMEIAGERGVVKLFTFRSCDGCPMYAYQIHSNLHYGILSKEMTGWIVNIVDSNKPVEYTKSGVMIFNRLVGLVNIDNRYISSINEIQLVYKQENIIEPFLGILREISENSDIYQCNEVDILSREKSKERVIKQRKSLVRIENSGIKLIVQFPNDEDKILGHIKDDEIKVNYYADKLVLWGMDIGDTIIYSYLIEGDTEIIGDYCFYGHGFYGYALDVEGNFYFGGNAIIMAQDMLFKGNARDFLVYSNENGVKKGSIITPELGKVIDIGIYDIVYREDGGWLKIKSREDNEQWFYYNGQVYDDMRQAYIECEQVETHSSVGQKLYVCKNEKGDWTIATQDMEPIGRLHNHWYALKQDAINVAKDILVLDDSEYLRARLGIGNIWRRI